MDRSNHLRAVADRGRDALDRAGADVADGEDAAAAGFQRIAVVARLGAGQDEAAIVELEAGSRQPVGVGLRADEGEEVPAPARRPRRRIRDRAG